MNNNPQKNREDALLDAVLGGESWPELNATAKNAALAEFNARRRRRRIRQIFAQAAAVVLLTAGIAWWPRPEQIVEIAEAYPEKVPNPPVVAVTVPTEAAASKPEPETAPKYISEAEMLALFPEGSCVVAEINGQKQLIFLDAKVEENGAPFQPRS